MNYFGKMCRPPKVSLEGIVYDVPRNDTCRSSIIGSVPSFLRGDLAYDGLWQRAKNDDGEIGPPLVDIE